MTHFPIILPILRQETRLFLHLLLLLFLIPSTAFSDLYWTEPADNGSDLSSGHVQSIEIRWNFIPPILPFVSEIEYWWANSPTLIGTYHRANPGETSYINCDLTIRGCYVLKATDESGNYSFSSNWAYVKDDCEIPIYLEF